MTAHVETGESLPRALFDKMIAAKNFRASMQTLRQIEFALFDASAHRARPANDVMPLLAKVRNEVAVLQPPAFQPHAHLQPYFCGRLRGGTIQLQVGRGLECRCPRSLKKRWGLTASRALKQVAAIAKQFWKQAVAANMESFKKNSVAVSRNWTPCCATGE